MNRFLLTLLTIFAPYKVTNLHNESTAKTFLEGECFGYRLCFRSPSLYGVRMWIVRKCCHLMFPQATIKSIHWPDDKMCYILTDKYYHLP